LATPRTRIGLSDGVPIAESSDLIVELGKWVMVESCKLLAQDIMRQSGVRLSVNLSPRHFRQSGFVSWMKQVLLETGANPNRLTLEITEGLMIDNIHDVIAKMSELHDLGIHFSIDDFGTGYSSLAYIKRLPIQELKIDKTFVQEAPVDADDAALVETILAIAKHLKLSVVAEGVETPEQAAFLNARADVTHQGYLFGKPEPAAYWLAQWQESLK
jgi:EAL domain-containing protein (putative c-di-GMP-specific phosphodiesterase class I)